MSTVLPTREQSSSKPSRVLACVLCQQRKIKCNRVFPCSNCVKSSAQCVPATLGPRRRRRRFPERELLDRLQLYENLLRENNIEFEPIRTPASDKASPGEDGTDEARSPRETKSETVYEPKNLWQAMNQRSQDPDEDEDGYDDDNDDAFAHDDVREAVVQKVWDQLYDKSNDHLLFGSRNTNVGLETLHPNHAHVFKLWQIYLDNVNPLLKVTHTPTLQARIIDAANDMANISPVLEALMFSIYCLSILSLDDDGCQTLFGSPKEDLLTIYRFGCRESLLNSGVLRTGDRDCLTALYLYLISVRPDADPRSISSMLGLAFRIAQRMGLHNESSNAKCTPLEAEMRRRLWWSLVIFDNRICEMSELSPAMMIPTWDCRPPANINDSDIRPEMKIPPAVHKRPTEALLAVVRSELGDFIRHSDFHLDFINPSLKSISKDTRRGSVPDVSDMVALEQSIEDKYLNLCDLENPIHFMTFWTTRALFAKNRLLQLYSRYTKSPIQQTDAQRNAAMSNALAMLECDTKLMTSPLTEGYRWQTYFHFPFPAYIHITQDLKKRPMEEHAERSWKIMSENYDARPRKMKIDENMFFKVFFKIVLQAWSAYEAACRQQGKSVEPPRIVLDIRNKMMQMAPKQQDSTFDQQPNNAMDMNMDDFSMPAPIRFGGHSLSYDFGGQDLTSSWPANYADGPGQATTEFNVNQLNWNMTNQNPLPAPGWRG